MKITLVVAGGVDRSGEVRVVPALLWLIERLAKQHQLLVIATQQEPHPSKWELRGATIVNLGYNPKQRHLSTFARLPSYLVQSYRLIGEWGRPDVLHGMSLGAPGLLAALLGRLLRIPVVASIWGGELVALPDIGYGGQLRIGSRFMVSQVLRLANAITGGSRYALKPLGQRANVHCIPLGVDTDVFQPNPTPCLDTPRRLLQVASINRVKHPELLLETLHAVRMLQSDVILDWVGEDTLNGRIQQMGERMGLRHAIHFHGFLPSQQTSKLCQQAALYLQTSHHESQGVSVLEAASCAVPTVGTSVGSLSELAPKAGMVVNADARSTANAVVTLLGSEMQRRQMGEAAQAWAQQHNATWTARQFEQLYQELLTDH